ncbi:hypothetical protein MTO96_040696 [Rhipicephalus appendiculatus]
MNTSLKSSTTECRKFAPNIFNKSKCQNCFRTKDAHSAEALESNRAATASLPYLASSQVGKCDGQPPPMSTVLRLGCCDAVEFPMVDRVCAPLAVRGGGDG